MSSIRKTNININDNERMNLKDRLGSGLKGRVIIQSNPVGQKDNKKVIHDISNLIVYRGRNWLVQRAFNDDLSSRAGWKSRYINLLAVGVLGAEAATPLTPKVPALVDIGLDGHGIIGAGERYVTVDAKDYHFFDAGYPNFLHDPDIVASFPVGCTETDPNDSDPYPCDQFLIGQTQTTIESTEANGDGVSTGCGIYATGPLTGESYQDINEAALYTAPSIAPATLTVEIFSRVCFSTIRKDSRRELTFTWLVYF